MKLITEEIIKKIIKDGKAIIGDELRLPPNSMLTPSAQSLISDNKLKLVLTDEGQSDSAKSDDTDVMNTASKMAAKSLGKFKLETGGFLNEKPEYMTQLYGSLLVNKDHKRIKLRGEVDLLMSEILKVQIKAKGLSADRVVSDLQEVYNFINEMNRAEVLDEPLERVNVLGLNQKEIRSMSHNPKKYFGLEHLFNIDYKIGEIAVHLNYLRSKTRKVEIACYEAFKTEPKGDASRGDLIEGYNRLSSIMYIIIFRYLSNQYEKEK